MPDFAYELLASIVAGLAWRKEQSILMETFIKWLEFAGDAAQARRRPRRPRSSRAGRRSRRLALRRHAMRNSPRRSAPSRRERGAVAAAEADVVQREERCAAVEADAVERMERLVKAEADLQEREEAVKRREAAVASAAADAAMAGADLDAREAKLRERERQLCTAPPVKVEPNEWADAVAASAEHHLRELSLENKQLKRHQRRTAKRGRRIAAVLLWRKMHVLDARTGAQKAFAAWYVFSQNTQPSTKQKRVRAARLCLESRAGAVLDGVHAHTPRPSSQRGPAKGTFVRTVLGVGKGTSISRRPLLRAYLMHLARDVLRGGRRTVAGPIRAGPGPTRARGGGQGRRAALGRRGARVLDCMETSNGLAKVGLSRAVKFRHG